ncbi:hypothetical protein [Plasticicumulans acidivorans]|uniref:Uncharacterized protein n=1 Tax=Plasticicumulans acidivorans TaxID=886464 RepID=A0A317MW75_9GAMM|nr:hypothetical protein [Plasticicumulans acidivorans]PWV62210.1 hypothetical protein C7443_1044 [Plasticicumulans acidivorans]
MNLSYWVQTCENWTMTNHPGERPLLFRHSGTLDGVCSRLGVLPLITFVDEANYEYRLCDEVCGEPEEDEFLLDPLTGLPLRVEDNRWFAASRGLETFSALRSQLLRGVLPGCNAADTAALRSEVAEVLSILEPVAARGGRFHLCVV